MQYTATLPVNVPVAATKKPKFFIGTANSEATKKILFFAAILACVVAAVNL